MLVCVHVAIRYAIEQAGGVLASPSLKFGHEPSDRLVENLMASVSEFHRDTNTQQVNNRMKARLMNGYWTFAKPLGYQYQKHPLHNKLLVPVYPLARIIKEAQEGFACGRFTTQMDVRKFLETSPLFPKMERTITASAA